MPYYSARLHVVSIVNNMKRLEECEHICDYPFVVFEATDDDAAFQRALELGQDQETEYENSDGELVRWRLRAVEHIWKLGDEMSDKEIGSIMDVYRPDEPLDFDSPFSPKSELPMFSDESNA